MNGGAPNAGVLLPGAATHVVRARREVMRQSPQSAVRAARVCAEYVEADTGPQESAARPYTLYP